jgi:TetR/AcrR family transcriptional repressor of nem operon
MPPDALSALTWSVWEGALLRMKVEGSVRPLSDSIALVLNQVYPPPTAARARKVKAAV